MRIIVVVTNYIGHRYLVYWFDQVIVANSEIVDLDFLATWVIRATILPLPEVNQSLLVWFEVREDIRSQAAYTAMNALACELDKANRQALVSLVPLTELRVYEQQMLKDWLISRNWPAWARAAHTVRSRLGVSDEPMLLSRAAVLTHIPVTTLQTAAASERLPTITAADRQLVYIETVVEAQQRGLPGLGRGRPRRRRKL